MGQHGTGTATTLRPVELVKVSDIHLATNDRKVFAKTEISALAASIAEHGLISPLAVRVHGSGYELMAGERRLRAVTELGWTEVPAIVYHDASDKAASATMLIENMHRVNLTPIEEAVAYRERMTAFGLSESDVARWAHVGLDRVKARLELLALRDDVQHLVASGAMPLNYAACLVILDQNRQGIALAEYMRQDQRPSLTGWRKFTGDLLFQQQQEALFDADLFQVETIVLQAQDEGGEDMVVPTDPNLPEVDGGRSFVETLAGYVKKLQASDDPHHQEAALAVGTVLAGCMKHHHLGARPRRRRNK